MNIAIIGTMGSGKTTCSKYLVENYGFTRISLAGPIYWIVNEMETGDPRDLYYKHLHQYTKKFLKEDQIQDLIGYIKHTKKCIPNELPKPRLRLQYLGTEGGRQVDDEIWIKILLARVAENPDLHYVVDDLRFKNELEALSDADFYSIKLDIATSVREQRLIELYGKVDKKAMAHRSEVDIEALPGDVYIDTGQSLEETRKELDKIVKGALT